MRGWCRFLLSISQWCAVVDNGRWLSWTKMNHVILVEGRCVNCWYPSSAGSRVWRRCPKLQNNVLMGSVTKGNGHASFICSMTMGDSTVVMNQHKNWHLLDIPSYQIHHILQIWPHRTMCSKKWKNHSAEENSLPVMTWREVSTSLCVVSPKTGALQLSKSYQRDGNSAQTLVASMSKVLQCDLSPVISRMLVTQMSVNRSWMAFIITIK
jgi:hypothetical protein